LLGWLPSEAEIPSGELPESHPIVETNLIAKIETPVS
jgi:hypothetical protein